MGNFIITTAQSGEHYFNLKADNSRIILTSLMYSSKPECFNGIESVRVNCIYDIRYERKKSVNNKNFFVLKASDGLIIGNSEMYSSTAAMEVGIQSVKKNGNNTNFIEEEPYF